MWKSIWNHPRLSRTAKDVFMVIEDLIGENAEHWHGLRSMAKACRMSVSTLQAALAELEHENEIVIEHTGGPRETNRYRVVTKRVAPKKGAHRKSVRN